MSNVHRIMWLDLEIRQRKYPNCRKLSERFEISLRQANRDLEYLKNTLNAPISYVAAKRGFIYEDMTFILPNLVITTEEKKALSFLAYRYENFDGTENSQRIAKLFKNLSAVDNQEGLTPVFNINDNKITLFHKLTQCINTNRKINVSYIVPEGAILNLILHPYQIYGISDNDYLIAYCEEYGDFAVFRLDRLTNCTDNPQGFVKKKDFKPDTYVNLVRKKPFKAVLKTVSPDIKLSNMGNKLTYVNNQVYEIEFYDIDQFIKELLVSSQWDKIISPGWLRDKLKYRCNEILTNLDDTILV